MLAVFSHLAYGEQLSQAQCHQLGGVLTDVGCVMAKGEEAEKYKNAKMYMPNKKQCECSGGKWHEEHGCLAQIKRAECESMGGQIHPELGCVKLLSSEQCEKLGGKEDSDGTCEFE